MLPPKPYKLKCKSCGYSKIVKLKSDAFTGDDIINMSTTCPKCGKEMEKVEMGVLDKIFSLI